MSWRSFTIPISYVNSDFPDSAVIILSASGSIPVNGSYLYIDNLSFVGGTIGLEDHSALSGLLVFPNPVIQNKLVINLKNRDIRADYIDILDLHGKQIIRKDMINQHFPVSMDVSTLHAGEYFLKITSQNGTFSRKFIKQ